MQIIACEHGIIHIRQQPRPHGRPSPFFRGLNHDSAFRTFSKGPGFIHQRSVRIDNLSKPDICTSIESHVVIRF